MKNLFHYISFPVLISIIIVIALNLLLYIGTERLIYALEKKNVEQIEENVRIQNNILANRIKYSGLDGYYDKGMEGDTSSEVVELQTMASQMQGRIILLNSNFEVISDTYGKNRGQYIITQDSISAMHGEVIDPKYVGEDFIQITTGIYDKESAVGKGVIVSIVSLKDKDNLLFYIEEQRTAINGLILIFSVVFGLFMAFLMNHSFSDMKKEMNYIADGHQEKRLSEEGFREFHQIAVAFNKITDRYKELENSRQEFVSNVSHELKTPITSMKILADSLLMQDNVPIEIYEEFMNDIVHEIDRENQIITDLLDLVRMDKTSGELNITSTNINELLEVLLKRISPIAEKRDITIHLETMRQVIAEVDPVKLSLACNNLIENAVKYNNDGGMVKVYLNADHKFFYIRIKDNGVGIPEDCQERIFERFYRVDKARSRETGGTGLGLAITRNVILLHKGSIRVHSKEGIETTFTIRIPLNYVG